MKWLLPVLCIAAGPAYAQSPELEKTCMAVAKNFFMVDTLNVGVVQSFPEIAPPGARFKYSERADTKKADMTDTFDCEFDSVNAPRKILRFCVSRTCYAADEDDPERKRRFQEMQVLLQRGKTAN